MSEQEVAPAAAPESAPEQPKKKSAIGRIIGSIIVIAVIAGGGLAYKYLTGDVTIAKVGDCITETVKPDASDAKVVDCSKPEAKNKVIGIVENVPQADMDDADKAQLICDKFPTWENVIWYGKDNGKGQAWCLEKAK
ncbi:hypothetical protein Rhe02_80170 [Rhizocola hellebori]|uniref:Septum formation-related domain-containing protein n=1 Tax=Rhizocola hellebori TaxID=1392758 RepID=A0A8J3QHT3_9ACTN|nr:hypothetical protein [Rhizocola hellebori]GIH09950.1 hypothetical protein Rhe02_80170 [Rhizocola hellebori]